MAKPYLPKPKYSGKDSASIRFKLWFKDNYIKLFVVLVVAVVAPLAVYFYISFEREFKNRAALTKANRFIAVEANKALPGAFATEDCAGEVQKTEDKKLYEALFALQRTCNLLIENAGRLEDFALASWLKTELATQGYNLFNLEDILLLSGDLRKRFALGVSQLWVEEYKPHAGLFLFFPSDINKKETPFRNAPYGYRMQGEAIVCEGTDRQCLLPAFDALLVNENKLKFKKPITLLIETAGSGVYAKKLLPPEIRDRTTVNIELTDRPITRFRYRFYEGEIPSHIQISLKEPQ